MQSACLDQSGLRPALLAADAVKMKQAASSDTGKACISILTQPPAHLLLSCWQPATVADTLLHDPLFVAAAGATFLARAPGSSPWFGSFVAWASKRAITEQMYSKWPPAGRFAFAGAVLLSGVHSLERWQGCRQVCPDAPTIVRPSAAPSSRGFTLAQFYPTSDSQAQVGRCNTSSELGAGAILGKRCNEPHTGAQGGTSSRRYFTQLRPSSCDNWWLEAAPSVRDGWFKTSEVARFTPEEAKPYDLPPGYMVKVNSKDAAGRATGGFAIMQLDGSWIEEHGTIDSQSLEAKKVVLCKGRSYYSTLLGTLWWCIVRAVHSVFPFHVPGSGETVEWYLTPVLRGCIIQAD